MLVLSRKKTETVIIDTPCGERIVVHVTEIDRDKVRIGFDARPCVLIWRGEIHREATQGK